MKTNIILLVIGISIVILLILMGGFKPQSEVYSETQSPTLQNEDNAESESIAAVQPASEPEPISEPTLQDEDNAESESIAAVQPASEPEPISEPTPQNEDNAESESIAAVQPASEPEPISEPTAVTTPEYQRIEKKMGAGHSRGIYFSYKKELEVGDNITGLVEVWADRGDDLKTKWHFQIVDPEGNIERSWQACHNYTCIIGSHLDFNHSVSMSGLYRIRVINNSPHALSVYIKITPEGWKYSESGPAIYPWFISK